MAINTFINQDKLFIDEETLKAMTPSMRNVSDTETIYYAIALSQRNTIRDILGQDQYDDILADYTLFIDSGTIMSDCYTNLMNNFLKPILSFSTYKRLIDNLTFKLKEGGLRTVNDSSTYVAEGNDRAIIKQEITNDINMFIRDMKLYIYENQSCFPLYNKGFDGVGEHQINTIIGKVSNPSKSFYNKYR